MKRLQALKRDYFEILPPAFILYRFLPDLVTKLLIQMWLAVLFFV